jgi:hypothetical protein
VLQVRPPTHQGEKTKRHLPRARRPFSLGKSTPARQPMFDAESWTPSRRCVRENDPPERFSKRAVAKMRQAGHKRVTAPAGQKMRWHLTATPRTRGRP